MAADDMLNQSVSEHYRCPENFFDFALNGRPANEEGYFRFGPNAICYGHAAHASKTPAVSRLYDALADVVTDESRLKLPFSPTEIVDNLRLERYLTNRGIRGRCEDALRRLYYFLRPFTNLSMRKQVQKFYAGDWKSRAFPQWPVDCTVENLHEELLLLSMKCKRIEKVPFVWFWPKGARGCVMVTHDVETRKGRDYCGKLMDMDDAYGIKASFQIVPEKRYPVSGEFLETIRARGFEVGIQDLNHDGRLFDNKKRFLRRAESINRYAKEYAAQGFRAAVLYRKPDWYGALNFAFDLSMPNVAHTDPQRGGCCTVMPYFIGDILELPVTTTQDYTLFFLLEEYSVELWKRQLGAILGKNGLATFIIHPDYVIESKANAVYRNLLDYLRTVRETQDVWFALPTDVNSWWRARSKMSVVQDGSEWRIVGDGAQQAVLAYAENVNGRLVYDLTKASSARVS
jgi:hypothetical protein